MGWTAIQREKSSKAQQKSNAGAKDKGNNGKSAKLIQREPQRTTRDVRRAVNRVINTHISATVCKLALSEANKQVNEIIN